MVRASVHVRALAVASAASWLLPFVALALVGFSERGAAVLSLTSRTLIVVALAASVPGLALGVGGVLGTREAGQGTATRRQALLGTAASAAVLLVAGIASVAGAISGRRAEEELRLATEAAVRDFPGWNGGTTVGAASVYAFEIDPGSDLARIMLRSFDEPFRLFVFGVDNRGADEVTLDLEGARLHRLGGAITEAVPRATLLAHAPNAESSLVQTQLAPTRVPGGARFDGMLAFFARGESFQDVKGIEVKLNEAVLMVPGRYFTLDAKRAIDASRGR